MNWFPFEIFTFLCEFSNLMDAFSMRWILLNALRLSWSKKNTNKTILLKCTNVYLHVWCVLILISCTQRKKFRKILEKCGKNGELSPLSWSNSRAMIRFQHQPIERMANIESCGMENVLCARYICTSHERLCAYKLAWMKEWMNKWWRTHGSSGGDDWIDDARYPLLSNFNRIRTMRKKEQSSR